MNIPISIINNYFKYLYRIFTYSFNVIQYSIVNMNVYDIKYIYSLFTIICINDKIHYIAH